MPFKSRRAMRAYLKRWRAAHPDYMRQWNRDNPGYHSCALSIPALSKFNVKSPPSHSHSQTEL